MNIVTKPKESAEIEALEAAQESQEKPIRSEPKTIEEMFVQEFYKREDEISNLQGQLLEQENLGGFFNEGGPIDLVKLQLDVDNYSMFDRSNAPFKDASLEEVEAIAALSFDDALERLSGIRGSYGSMAFEIFDRTFPFIVRFKTYKDNSVYVYDPEYDSHQLYTYLTEENEPESGEWFLASCRDALTQYSVNRFLEVMSKRAEKLRNSPNDGDDE